MLAAEIFPSTFKHTLMCKTTGGCCLHCDYRKNFHLILIACRVGGALEYYSVVTELKVKEDKQTRHQQMIQGAHVVGVGGTAVFCCVRMEHDGKNNSNSNTA